MNFFTADDDVFSDRIAIPNIICCGGSSGSFIASHYHLFVSQEYSLEEIAKKTHVVSTREAYKALGKAPHEYRNAAEAMLRRIIKGKGLYHINNVVDINNLIPMKCTLNQTSQNNMCSIKVLLLGK